MSATFVLAIERARAEARSDFPHMFSGPGARIHEILHAARLSWRPLECDALEARVIVVQVSVRAKPEHADRLEQILCEVVGEARQLEGCMRYEWYRSPDVERGVFVYAEFDSEEAFADYRKGPVVKKIGEQLIPMLEAPPSYKHFSATVIQQG